MAIDPETLVEIPDEEKPKQARGMTNCIVQVDKFTVLNQDELINDMHQGFGAMGKELASAKVKQYLILEESRQQGGPTDVHGAILNLMDTCNVGIRRLSVITNVPRKRLLAMINGRVDMPSEVFDKIYEVFKQIKPMLFSDTEIPVVRKTKM